MNSSEDRNRGSIFIVAAPSGAGKSTICRSILQRDDCLRFSVSYTSRKPRKGEVDGVDYHFVTREQFKNKIDQDEFLEWAVYVENYYGTAKTETEAVLDSGEDILLDIDIQGADQIKEKVPECVRIFILPPSKRELEKRLIERGTNSGADLEKRIATARVEVKRAKDFDFIVINDDLDKAVKQVEAIIKSHRQRTDINRVELKKVLHSFDLAL